MARTARIKSSPPKWCAWGLVISGMTGQNILKFDWWVVIDMEYRIVKVFLNFYYLFNVFTAQNWLKLDPQLPKIN